jgi:hypothetical protein
MVYSSVWTFRRILKPPNIPALVVTRAPRSSITCWEFTVKQWFDITRDEVIMGEHGNALLCHEHLTKVSFKRCLAL